MSRRPEHSGGARECLQPGGNGDGIRLSAHYCAGAAPVRTGETAGLSFLAIIRNCYGCETYKLNPTDIVAPVRSTGKAEALGVTAREADYNKPETLNNALNRVDTLLLISSNEVGRRAVQHENVTGASRKAGVKRIVYTSLLRADSSPLSLAGEHRETELALQASCIPYTILRNGWYTENYTASIPGAVGGGVFLGCAGEARISSASRGGRR